ncbi:mycofactocin biosynthesis peptidyl-dipeptidase MftE, partial [Mycobacteroides abscessus subsp. abscessus]|nr:mycofactocin biosynthesis peptidyl-dipeptidase MftE [Mycobacteroides abscessus subsp. abscessus]
ARMLETMTRQCADAVRRWTPDADGRLV